MSPLLGLLKGADDLLRVGVEGPAARVQRPPDGIPRLGVPPLVLILTFGCVYGAAMGTSGGFAGDRALQVVYSAVKVPFLMLATFVLSLPPFFVLNTLLGLRDDLPRIIASLLATQAAITVILASLAPFTLFWYVSVSAYQPAILFNGLMFAVASFSAQRLLRRLYRPLIAKNPLHRGLLRTWMVIYVFVGIQMGWVLRPFVGDPDLPVRFFREHSWSNAYVVVGEMIVSVLTRTAR